MTSIWIQEVTSWVKVTFLKKTFKIQMQKHWHTECSFLAKKEQGVSCTLKLPMYLSQVQP